MSFAKDFTRAVLGDKDTVIGVAKSSLILGACVGTYVGLGTESLSAGAAFAAATTLAIPTVACGATAAYMGVKRAHAALMNWANS